MEAFRFCTNAKANGVIKESGVFHYDQYVYLFLCFGNTLSPVNSNAFNEVLPNGRGQLCDLVYQIDFY